MQLRGQVRGLKISLLASSTWKALVTFAKAVSMKLFQYKTGCREPRRDFEVRKKEINIISKMYGK